FDHSVVAAIVLEAIALAPAPTMTERASWADRLAGWRRARQDISTQLRMSEGLVPWLATALERFTTGVADRPTGTAFDRIGADLADAEHRASARLSAIAVPENVRQSMIASVQSLTAR